MLFNFLIQSNTKVIQSSLLKIFENLCIISGFCNHSCEPVVNIFYEALSD